MLAVDHKNQSWRRDSAPYSNQRPPKKLLKKVWIKPIQTTLRDKTVQYREQFDPDSNLEIGDSNPIAKIADLRPTPGNPHPPSGSKRQLTTPHLEPAKRPKYSMPQPVPMGSMEHSLRGLQEYLIERKSLPTKEQKDPNLKTLPEDRDDVDEILTEGLRVRANRLGDLMQHFNKMPHTPI
jgi:hypothetical protein